MKFADRLDRLPPYLFSQLRQKIADMRAQGIDVISLGAGDPDMATPDIVVRAAQTAIQDPANHHYPDNRGKPAFRQAAAEFMRMRFGVDLDVEHEIYAVLGGKEAIHHLGLACLGDGDVCLAPDPAYPVYKSAAALAGAELHDLPLEPRNGFLPDLSAVPDDVCRRARLLYLNYPNNPTGAVADSRFFSDVVAFAQRHNLVVVHDNSYSEIAFDGYRPCSFLGTPGATDVGVEVFSLSKGWNMTGWRIGWLAGNREVVRRYGHLKPNIDAGMPGAMQDAAIAATREAADFPHSMSAVYQRRRDLMVDALTGVGLDIRPQKATPFLWIPVPDGFTSMSFADLLLEKAGVVVSPGHAFGAAGEGFFRIALMVPDERLREAAQRMQSVLSEAP